MNMNSFDFEIGKAQLLTVWYPTWARPPEKLPLFHFFLWMIGIDRSREKKQKMQSDFLKNFDL